MPCFESAFVLCLILLDSFVDVELERKGALGRVMRGVMGQ